MADTVPNSVNILYYSCTDFHKEGSETTQKQ